jgi:hypothetical protein
MSSTRVSSQQSDFAEKTAKGLDANKRPHGQTIFRPAEKILAKIISDAVKHGS